MKCLRCGKIITEDCTICPDCGFQVRKMDTEETKANQTNLSSEEESNDENSFCAYCGTRLKETDVFCPKCGKRKDESENIDFKEVALTDTKRKSKGWYLIILAVLCIIFIGGIVIFTKKRSPDFRKLYQTYCKTYWADVGSDGSYLYIDTNPQDKDDSGLAYPEAAEAIKNINDALGIPESVINEMGQTTFIDGKQTETFEKQKVSISWRYHPDKGLEVTYTKLK